jgi:RNA polymerase sigma factor for flagellar operon FliA
MDAEKVFLDSLGLIDRITVFVCRRNRLQPADADEFGAHVRFKLYEDDYAILRKFEGRSTLSTYLTTVIQRLFFQWRVQMWGKWRPSAEAKRLGDKAMVLERLLTRDGYTLDEAARELTFGHDPLLSRAELEAIYLRLPQRQPRPVLVSEGASAEISDPASADDGVLHEERECRARAVAAALDRAMESCEAEDRLILQLRFWHARKVSDIATTLHIDSKKLYKRIERLLARLRVALQRDGIPRETIVDLLDHGDHNVTIDWEKRGARPSDSPDGDRAVRQGRLSK